MDPDVRFFNRNVGLKVYNAFKDSLTSRSDSKSLAHYLGENWFLYKETATKVEYHHSRGDPSSNVLMVDVFSNNKEALPDRIGELQSIINDLILKHSKS